MDKISELLCIDHQGDDYQEDFGKKCPICMLKEKLSAAEARIKVLEVKASAWDELSQQRVIDGRVDKTVLSFKPGEVNDG